MAQVVQETEVLDLPLKEKAKAALQYIVNWVETRGYSPTFDEICTELDFVSAARIWYEFRSLESDGYLWIIKTRLKGAKKQDTIVPAGYEDLPAGALDSHTARTWIDHPELLIPPPKQQKDGKTAKPKKPQLTKTERKNYDLIRYWLSKHKGKSNPTFDDMYRSMCKEFGVRTAKSVERSVEILLAKGYLPLDSRRSKASKSEPRICTS